MARIKLVRRATLVGIGAAAAYLFDPERGRARRAKLRDQTVSKARGATRDAERQLEYAQGRLDGAAAKASGAGQFTPESDTHLREHLRQVIAEAEFPTTDVTVDVVDGVATLRGQLRTPDQVKTLRATVADVPGVERVESFLHLPDTPAPNKADAIKAT